MKPAVKYTNEEVWQEPWMRQYKYGVILFIPPEPVLSQVDKLRKKYDLKSHNNCCAHISLTIPIPRPLYETDVTEITKLCEEIKPFEVTYGPVTNFLPDANGVVLEISEQDRFSTLVKQIEKASVFDDAESRKWPYKAHMTIAEFISTEETKDLTELLNREGIKGRFLCSEVEYMVPDKNFRFIKQKTFEFRGNFPEV